MIRNACAKHATSQCPKCYTESCEIDQSIFFLLRLSFVFLLHSMSYLKQRKVSFHKSHSKRAGKVGAMVSAAMAVVPSAMTGVLMSWGSESSQGSSDDSFFNLSAIEGRMEGGDRRPQQPRKFTAKQVTAARKTHSNVFVHPGLLRIKGTRGLAEFKRENSSSDKTSSAACNTNGSSSAGQGGAKGNSAKPGCTGVQQLLKNQNLF